MACHIIPASAGKNALRQDPTYPRAKIGTAENGVWMCYTHGKLIDADEARYTAEMLRIWRKVNERRVQIRHETGKEVGLGDFRLADIKLAKGSVAITCHENENALIGELLNDCALPLIWGGQLAGNVRDVLIEITRNAFVHGGAVRVEVVVSSNQVSITDNGSPFDPSALLRTATGRGGQHAMRSILRFGQTNAIAAYRRRGTVNEFSIGRPIHQEDVKAFTLCAVEHATVDYRSLKADPVISTCGIVYILIPRFWCRSDAYRWPKDLLENLYPWQQVVFIADDVTEETLSILKERVPNCEIVRLR